jgi:ATP-dependent DNA helicase RecG
MGSLENRTDRLQKPNPTRRQRLKPHPPTPYEFSWLDDLPTVAAEILFNDEPQTVLPKTSVKIYRYKTDKNEGTRDTLDFNPITVEGSACHLIENAVAKTIEVAEKIPALGLLGFEKIRYPKEAIHEVITNAVMNRDYSVKDDIHVRIFNNIIEIQSPGTLPGHVTVDNILDELFAHNPKIVRMLNNLPDAPNKDIGEGLNTTFQVMRELKLKDPIIEQKPNTVLVKLPHEPLVTYEEIIVNYFLDMIVLITPKLERYADKYLIIK